MKVKIKKLHPDAVIPKYAKSGDACLDLTAVDYRFNKNYIEYDTGLSFEIPHGHVGLIFPRSSVTNKSMILKNSVGVIDSSYRGSVTFRFYRLDSSSFDESCYKEGDRVGQILIVPHPHIEFEEVEELSVSDRKDGGFGSTGT